jgi:PKD repeat protein
LLAALVASAIGVVAGAGTAAAAIPILTHPGLQQVRVISENPIAGSSIKPKDAEGLAYVPSDNSMWVADDNLKKLYEIDVTTGQYKRTITQAQLAAATTPDGSQTAGTNTAYDFEALAYDDVHDELYVFAGKCCTASIRAAAFRLTRDGNGAFQVTSFQPFTAPMNDFSGVGFIDDASGGHLWTALGKVLYQYDYAANTFSNSFTVPGISGKIDGIGDSPGGDVWVVNSKATLYRINWATRTLYPNHTFNMADYGIKDSRAVEVVGNQLFICDGYDSYATSSPDRYAIKVYDVVDLDATLPPVASFTTGTASGPAPLTVQFTDTSTVNPTSWSWSFGDGGTSTAQSPSHQYTQTGSFTATLTATNANGSSSATKSITVTGPENAVAVAKDASVNSASPTKNYGTVDYVRALAGSSEYRPYVAFNVSGLGAPVARAVLRLYVTDASAAGGTWYSVPPSWNETGITWNNAPQPSGAVLANVGPVTLNTWVDIDVTPAVTGNGSFSFAATTSSTNSLKYGSKESAFPPQLVITVGDSSSPPLAGFTADTTSGPAPLAVQFTDASTANTTSWSWSFGDGGTSSAENPSHTFTQAGSWAVTLTAGNANGTSQASTTITVSPSQSTVTIPVAADALVSAALPAKNYGTYDYLRGLLAPPEEYRPYVLFNVTGVTGTVSHAVLRLYVTDGTDNAGAWYTVAPTWAESTLTWANAPVIAGTPVATGGSIAANSWIEVDVTSAVTGNGPISFAGLPASTNSLRYSSKEGLNPPQLVITTT